MECQLLNSNIVRDIFFRQIKNPDLISQDSMSRVLDTVRSSITNNVLTTEDIDLISNALINSADEFDVDLTELFDVHELVKAAWVTSKKEGVYRNLVNPDQTVFIEEDLPFLKNGLFTIYKDNADQAFFLKNSKASLINAVFINPRTRELVDTTRSLNASIRDLQNKLARELASYLNIEEKDIYTNRTFNDSVYKNLIAVAQARFSSLQDQSGLYEGNDRSEKVNFDKYILLTNFDDFVTQYFNDLLQVDPLYKGTNNVPRTIEKYSLSLGKHIKQNFTDNLNDAATHTNGAVQLFINSIPKLDKNLNIIPNNFVSFREFQSLLRIIRESNIPEKFQIREDPYNALKTIMTKINDNPTQYFKASDLPLLPTFRAVYQNIFNTQSPNSLISLNQVNTKILKNDIYSMILNHMNKMTAITYTSVEYDKDEDSFITLRLSSDYLSEKKNALERHFMLNTLLDYTNVFEKYEVTFNRKTTDQGNTITGMQVTIGGKNYSLDFLNTKYNAKEMVENFQSSEFIQFFADVFRYNINKDFMELLVSINTPEVSARVFNLSMNVLLNAELSQNYNRNGSNKAYIAKQLPEGVLSETNEKQWYDSKLHSLRIAGINSGLGGLEALGKTVAAINGDNTKSYVINGDGNKLPKYRLTNLGNDDLYLFGDLINNSQLSRVTGKPDPMTGNLFVTNFDLIKDTRLKTDFTNKNGITKSISSMNEGELIYDQFISSFLALNKEGEAAFQPMVYADKSNIWEKVIDLKKRFSYRNVSGETIVDNKSLSELSLSELDNLYFSTMQHMLVHTKELINRDFDTLFGEINRLFNKDLKGSINDRLGKINERQMHTAILSLQSKGQTLSILPEIHYSYNKAEKKYYFNHLLQNYFDTYTESEKMSDKFRQKIQIEDKLYGVVMLTNDVRFETRFADETINRVIEDNINFSEAQEDLWSILSPQARGQFDSNSYKDIWKNKETETLRNFILLDQNNNIVEDRMLNDVVYDDNYTIILNPYLKRFKTLDNIVSNNYNAATVGMPFLHPAKVISKTQDWKDIKAEESARTTAMYKRGVIVGATGHPFIKGKRTGIPNSYRLAVVNDLFSDVFGIKADFENDSATQYDGSIWLNPLTAIWEQNSLEELTLSTVHRKPIGYVSMSDYMSSMLLKCATFTVSNELARSSTDNRVKGKNILKNMLNRQWDIPNLDITAGGTVNYAGQIYKSPVDFKIYRIDSITKNRADFNSGLVNNVYTITTSQLNEFGVKLPGTTQTTMRSINSNYELWEALGAENSMSLYKGKLQLDESSIQKVAEVASSINITNNSPEVIELRNNGINYNIPETSLINNQYYQPMKYSNVDYLSNMSGIKNGATNVNPSYVYTNNTIAGIDLQNDKVVFAHPGIGKTTALKTGLYDMVVFEDTYKSQISNYNGDDLGGYLLQLFNSARETGKTVVFSNPDLFDALLANDIRIDKMLTMSNAEYIEREKKRDWNFNESEVIQAKDNYNSLVEEATELFGVTPIDVGKAYLSDYLNRSNLTYSEIDPDFLVIQLNAEHDIDDSLVSEMTQVISALEQKGTRHDLANAVFLNIGKVIYEGLNQYLQYDLNTEEGQSALYNLLGKSLVKAFGTGNRTDVGLTSAYIQFLQEGINNNELLSKQKFKIPFDDNNIYNVFLSGFTNGLNKDLIKRQYSGLNAVLNPSQDLFTLYDTDSGVSLYKDFLLAANSREEFDAIKRSLDKDVQVGEIRPGDWVEIDGFQYLVNTYNSAREGEISLREVRDRRVENATIRKIGSRGRNLRAQNISFDIESQFVNFGSGLVRFDQYDLDSSRLSYLLGRFLKLNNKLNKQGQSLEADELVDYEELLNIFDEVNDSVQEVYPQVDMYNFLSNEQKLRQYIEVAIQRDLSLISEGMFRIPIKYRSGETAIAPMQNTQYTANEIALGKPWATKFMLEEGDSLGDILSQGVGFFLNKLTERRTTAANIDSYDLYLSGANPVHFVFDQNTVDKLLKEGKIKIMAIDQIVKDNRFFRVLPNGDSYEISENMIFYTLTNDDGSKSELIYGARPDNVNKLWNSKVFSGYNFNYQARNVDNLLLIRNNFPTLSKRQIADSENKLELLQALNTDQRNNTTRVEQQQAQKMATSFQEAINYIVARIPAQSMQSFMNMTITGFIDANTNIAYVPVEQLIYQGSDYDIDKTYILGASVTGAGVYNDWSPYFDYTSKETFELSKELPFPNGKEYIDVGPREDALDLTQYISTFTNAYANSENYDLVALTEMLEKVNNWPNNYLNGTSLLLEIVNTHNSYIYNNEEAIKNKIFDVLWKTGADPSNFISETTAITMGEARDATKLSSSGQFSSEVSNDNPGAKAVLQWQNSVGKTSIGTSANGIKVFSTLLNYYHNGLINANLNRDPVEKFILNPEGYKIGEDVISQQGYPVYTKSKGDFFITQGITLPNINWNQISHTSNSSEFTLTENGLTTDQLRDLYNTVTKAGFGEDVFGTLSVLLSASTDNAKELILEKINASGRMASIYIYLLVTGVDFKTTAQFMTSDIVSLVHRKSQRSVVSDENKFNSIDSAIKYYKDGVKVQTYLGRDYNTSITEALTRLNSQIGIPVDELSKFENYFTELSKTDEGIQKIREIMKVIEKNKSVIKISPIKRMSREDAEFYEAQGFDEDFGQAIPKKSIKGNSAFLLNRYLNEVINRALTLRSIDQKELANLDILNKFKEGAEEISMLARLTAINQGIRTLPYEKFSGINNINEFMTKKIGQKDANGNEVKFDLIRFVGEDNYRQMWTALYEERKTTFNILDIIANTPHFRAMYEVLAFDDFILKRQTLKYKLFNDFGKDLFAQGILKTMTQKDASTINRYSEDLILNKYFNERFTKAIDIGNTNVYDTSGYLVESEDGILTLDSVYGRASFKYWMENTVIPELKQKYPKNNFVNSLIMNYFTNSFGGIYSLYQLPIDLTKTESEADQVAYSTYLRDFTTIKNDMYSNMTIEDLFFVYNLLLNKNQSGSHSLTRIFENSLQDPKDGSVILDFMSFESELAGQDIDFNIQDLYIRFLNDNNKYYSRGYDSATESSIIVRESDKSRLDIFTENINIITPFQDGTVSQTQISQEFLNKLINLVLDGKAQIKLKCDD